MKKIYECCSDIRNQNNDPQIGDKVRLDKLPKL